MIYVTYFYEGQKRKAIVTLDMYNELKENEQVLNLIIHPTEQTMNESFSGSKHKSYLKG
jgi:hypothetical protein